MSANRALAAKRFFAAAINDYGITEGDHVRIPMRQCELARQRNISASTVGAYLTAMGDAVVTRRPEIVLAETTTPSLLAHRSEHEVSPTAPSTKGEVLELLAELLEVQSRLIRAIAGRLTTPSPSGDGLRIEYAEDAQEPRERPDPARDPRSFRADQEEGRKQAELPSFLQDSNRDIRAETLRRSAQYDELLRPLHRPCRDLHLTPLNNRTTLEQALAPYSHDEIATAVHDIARRARSGGSNIASPFGLLVARARRGDLAPEPTPTSPARPLDDLEPADMHDDGVLDEVITLEADPNGGDVLESLDAEIMSELPAYGKRAIPQPMRSALRAAALRRLRAHTTQFS